MFDKVRTGAIALVAVAALALGGSAIAGAADDGGSTGSGASSTAAAQRPPGPPTGANGMGERALSADVAAKVEQAALARLPGATVIRTETNADGGSAYEAHVRKADGTEVVVLVDEDFEVTAVRKGCAGGPGGPGGGAPPSQS